MQHNTELLEERDLTLIVKQQKQTTVHVGVECIDQTLKV